MNVRVKYVWCVNKCGCKSLFAKRLQNVCAKVRICKFLHTRTLAKCVQCACRCGCWCFFWKRNAKICAKVRTCEISHVRTSARVQSVCNVHASVVGWVILEIFEKMCAKVRMCENSHIRTPAHVRNVRNVRGGARGCKRGQAEVCGCDLTFTQTMFWPSRT